jgi:DNA-binding transcriptional ArsR family regulator
VPSDAVFSALANPVRRRLLELLVDGPRTAGGLAGQFELSRPAVSEHLGVLRRAGLVGERPSGRERHYHLAAGPLTEVGEWLHPFERYWRERMRALSDVVDDLPDGTLDGTPDDTLDDRPDQEDPS